MNTSIPDAYKGRLVATWGEQNLYHDSYWEGLLWSDEKGEPVRVMFGTTAAGGDMWFPPRGLQDLTPERMALYKAWVRRKEIERRWRERGQDMRDAAELGITYHQLRDLREALGDKLVYTRYGRDHSAALEAVEALLRTKKFRSDFRRSLAEQTRAWLATPRAEREHDTPLSMRQLRAVAR